MSNDQLIDVLQQIKALLRLLFKARAASRKRPAARALPSDQVRGREHPDDHILDLGTQALQAGEKPAKGVHIKLHRNIFANSRVMMRSCAFRDGKLLRKATRWRKKSKLPMFGRSTVFGLPQC